MRRGFGSFTLIELIIALVIFVMIVFAITNFEIFIRSSVLGAERRTQVQNELYAAMEHMTKHIAQATGRQQNPTVPNTCLAALGNGIRVRVDPNHTATLADDLWYDYELGRGGVANTLTVTCTNAGGVVGGVPCPFGTQMLSNRIFPNTFGPAGGVPANGFQVTVFMNNTSADIVLAGLFNPAWARAIDNPLVTIRTTATVNQ